MHTGEWSLYVQLASKGQKVANNYSLQRHQALDRGAALDFVECQKLFVHTHFSAAEEEALFLHIEAFHRFNHHLQIFHCGVTGDLQRESLICDRLDHNLEFLGFGVGHVDCTMVNCK